MGVAQAAKEIADTCFIHRLQRNLRSISRMKIGAVSTFIFLCVMTSITSRAELLVNGNFEGGSSNGIPSFWTYDSTGQLMSTDVVSPFTDVYPSSTTSILMTEPHLALRQYFPATSGQLSLSFDFMMPETGSSYWHVSLQGSLNGSSRIPFNLRMDGTFWPTGSPVPLLTLEPLAWYHVQTEVDLDASVYHGSITPFGQPPVTWSDYRFAPGFSDIREVLISTALDPPDHAPIYLDNFRIVPEPRSLVWIAMALVLMCPFARRAI